MHPWTTNRTYRRDPDPKPPWSEEVCAANNSMMKIGDDAYYLSADGKLMPTRKDQPPPDTSYFKTKR